MSRSANTNRATKETSIDISVELDGSGATDVATGLPFFDHMLDQLGRHGASSLVRRSGHRGAAELPVQDHRPAVAPLPERGQERCQRFEAGEIVPRDKHVDVR